MLKDNKISFLIHFLIPVHLINMLQSLLLSACITSLKVFVFLLLIRGLLQ